jgi:hypothetical protein|tara:strand:+ start:3952 stop:4695 length:744 start_codon:yes stop_codon:yes gene_type:complete
LKIKALIILLFFIASSSFVAQKNDEKNRKVGFLVGTLVPINYFGVGGLEVSENNSSISINNKLGYNFGMLLKTDYSKKISLETGIIFCQRNFKLIGASSNQASILRDTSSFGYINYSSPIKGIIYVQLSKDLFMRNSIGFNIDYYASAVASKGVNSRIHHHSERARWINGSLSGELGIEKRSSKIGIFYLGAAVNIPISSIAVTRLRFYYDDQLYDSYGPEELRGNFFGIKLKYYLPVDMESEKRED